MSSQGLLLETEAEAPMVRGVKVLGTDSKNNREYPKEVMEKALKLYEGAPVNIDHQTDGKPRKYEDRFGRIVNPRMESDGIYADLIYNPQHPLAESFTWWAKHDPKNVGLSHNAQAKTRMTSEGVEVIDEIVRVDSVDLVAEPATTTGLLECIMEARRTVVEAKAPAGKESVKEAMDIGHMFGEALAKLEKGSVGGVNSAHQIVSDYLLGDGFDILKKKSKDQSLLNGYKSILEKALNMLDKAEVEAGKGKGVSSQTNNLIFSLVRSAEKIYSRIKSSGSRGESVKEASTPKKDDIINVLRDMRKRLNTIESASRPGEPGSMKADAGSGYQNSVLKNSVSGLEEDLNSPEMKALKSAGIATSSIIEPFNQVITKAKSGKQVPKSLCEKCKNLIGYLETTTANKKWKKESSVKEAGKVSNEIVSSLKAALEKAKAGSYQSARHNIKKAVGIAKEKLKSRDGQKVLLKVWPFLGIAYEYLAECIGMSKDPKKKLKLSAFLKTIDRHVSRAIELFSGLSESVEGKKMKKEDVVIPKPDVKTETDDLKKEIEAILGDEKMESDEKVERIMACMMPKTEGDEPSIFDKDEADMDGSVSDIVKMNDEEEETEEGDLVIKHQDDDDMEKPTEESLRRKQDPALKKLLEEVDAYRARDKHEKLVTEARQVCESAGLPKYAITKEFLGILADTSKKGWKNLVEDRRRVIYRGSTPVSTGAPDGKLSVDSLVKSLMN